MSTDGSVAPSALRPPRVDFLVEDDIGRDTVIEVSGLTLSLFEFLNLCAKSVGAESQQQFQQHADELNQACLTFINSGIDAVAVRPFRVDQEWIQIGIRPTEDPVVRGELFRRMSALVKGLLDESKIDNFFYMNKAPGMRLRFQAVVSGESSNLVNDLHAEVRRWRRDGLIDRIEPGVYEAESQLFGGPRSMRFVHALFTVNSLFWLDYHSHMATEEDEDSPAWLASLVLIRKIFTGLNISGWEDIGVWKRIRTTMGRQLGPENTALPKYLEIANEIGNAWSQLDTIEADLHPAVRALLNQYGDALTLGATRWHSGYFSQTSASIGPRAAAAFFVVFHWNRAALSGPEQAILAESLVARLR